MEQVIGSEDYWDMENRLRSIPDLMKAGKHPRGRLFHNGTVLGKANRAERFFVHFGN